jgi:hypothetical protein
LRDTVRRSVEDIKSRTRVMRVSRLMVVDDGKREAEDMVEFVVVVVVVREGVESVVASVVICELSEVRVERIGVGDADAVVVRPRLVSRAERRSDRVAKEDRVEGCGEDSGGAGC